MYLVLYYPIWVPKDNHLRLYSEKMISDRFSAVIFAKNTLLEKKASVAA